MVPFRTTSLTVAPFFEVPSGMINLWQQGRKLSEINKASGLPTTNAVHRTLLSIASGAELDASSMPGSLMHVTHPLGRSELNHDVQRRVSRDDMKENQSSTSCALRASPTSAMRASTSWVEHQSLKSRAYALPALTLKISFYPRSRSWCCIVVGSIRRSILRNSMGTSQREILRFLRLSSVGSESIFLLRVLSKI